MLILVAVLLLAGCAGDGRTPVVVYSPHGREMLQAAERDFEAAYPQYDVQALDMGSQEVLDRLRSEKANPQADVWWGAPADMFETAAGEGLLTESNPSWAEAVRAAGHADDAGMWWGNYLTPEVIAYNTAAISAADAPRDWEDVLDPRWKDEVLIRDPLASGTMRTIFGMIIDRSIRETGDTAAGMAWLRRLDAQTKEYVLNPTLLYQKLARQEGLVTLWDQPDIDIVKGKGNFPIDYVLPASGTPVVVDAVAIPANAPHAEGAALFLEFVGDAPSVIRAAREFHRLPARADIPLDSLPPALQRVKNEMKVEPVDWARLQRESNTWMKYWDEHIRGRN